MQIFYNGSEITQAVEVEMLAVTDGCGDEADAIDAVFADSQGQWSGWRPQKGDTLEIAQEGYRTGTFWIDQIRPARGSLAVGAISLPPDGRTRRTKSWENITLSALAAEKAADYGLGLFLSGLPNQPYARVDQISRGDFGFLQERARLEGCSIKIDGGRLVVYSDREMESRPAVRRYTAQQLFEEPVFSDSAGQTYARCTVRWRTLLGEAEDPQALGPALVRTDLPVSSEGEARRFAQNLLRDRNKRESSGEIAVPLDLGVAGAGVVALSGLGLPDGRWFVAAARHDFSEQLSRLTLRRCFGRF